MRLFRVRAFTLVELLVVISIVALLLSLLLPQLSMAREMSRRVTCSANQRSIFTAAFSYTNDYKDYLPFGTDSSEGSTYFADSWGRRAGFYSEYLNVAMDPTSIYRFADHQKGPLWCPSGTRLGYQGTSIYASDWGWKVSSDYHLAGCAPTNSDNMGFLARRERFWQTTGTRRIFSMDIAVSYQASTQPKLAPHLLAGDCPAGVNVISTEGAGQWVSSDLCTKFGGNRPASGTSPAGIWQYLGWQYRLIPIEYEYLYPEYNYTFTWKDWIFRSANGTYAGSGTDTLDQLGVVIYPFQ